MIASDRVASDRIGLHRIGLDRMGESEGDTVAVLNIECWAFWSQFWITRSRRLCIDPQGCLSLAMDFRGWSRRSGCDGLREPFFNASTTIRHRWVAGHLYGAGYIFIVYEERIREAW